MYQSIKKYLNCTFISKYKYSLLWINSSSAGLIILDLMFEIVLIMGINILQKPIADKIHLLKTNN